jgi:excisionase family DNA binding protein
MQTSLMTAKDVAVALSVSKRHVWRLAASRQLPAPVRIGRLVRWRAEELNAWIAAGCPTRERWDAIPPPNGKAVR